MLRFLRRIVDCMYVVTINELIEWFTFQIDYELR